MSKRKRDFGKSFMAEAPCDRCRSFTIQTVSWFTDEFICGNCDHIESRLIGYGDPRFEGKGLPTEKFIGPLRPHLVLPKIPVSKHQAIR